eukprot:6414701-Prymnesium_polylepis.1
MLGWADSQVWQQELAHHRPFMLAVHSPERAARVNVRVPAVSRVPLVPNSRSHLGALQCTRPRGLRAA